MFNLRRHETNGCKSKIKENTLKKKILFSCSFCANTFLSKNNLKKHQYRVHFIRINKSYGIFDGLIRKYKQKKQEEFICNVCSIPKKFASKNELKRHSLRIHDGTKNKIRIGQSFLTLSDIEISGQEEKTVNCNMCEKQFKCFQDHHYHMRKAHNIKQIYLFSLW